MSGIVPKMVLVGGDWPWPVSRKTSEGGAKNLFCLSRQASLKDFSRRTLVFRAKRAQP